MDARKEQEKIFHDKLRYESFGQRWTPVLENTIRQNPLWTNMKYYSIERKSRTMVLDWFRENCQGKKALDYCCGNGEDSIYIAKNGAKEVIGIDISEVSIKNCKKRAIEEEVSSKVTFSVMDAESLEFENDTFDIITEYGALHHLNLEKAYSELARVVKKDGKVICNEALGHNFFINLYRKLTPTLRTEWEAKHILCKKDLELAKKYFGEIKVNFFHLTTLLAVPFRNLPGFGTVLNILEKLDGFLLKIPFVKWQAWQVVVVLSQPNKANV